MRLECRERFPRHRRQRKPLVSDPSMHHGTCVTHVPWCMPGSLTRGDGENYPSIPDACTTRNFTYLERGPCSKYWIIPNWTMMIHCSPSWSSGYHGYLCTGISLVITDVKLLSVDYLGYFVHQDLRCDGDDVYYLSTSIDVRIFLEFFIKMCFC